MHVVQTFDFAQYMEIDSTGHISLQNGHVMMICLHVC